MEWDVEKLYETGVSKGVLFPSGGVGVPWNGLTKVTEKPSGAEPTALYADNIKFINIISAEEYAATIECYTYPDEFGQCNGEADIAPGVSIGQQDRLPFGFAYQTVIGSDTKGTNHGYKIHIIYGAQASPSEVDHESINDSPSAGTFSYEISTTPVNVPGHKPTASLTIDSTKVDAEELAAFEKVLYGDDSTEARLPLPGEIATMFKKSNVVGD